MTHVLGMPTAYHHVCVTVCRYAHYAHYAVIKAHKCQCRGQKCNTNKLLRFLISLVHYFCIFSFTKGHLMSSLIQRVNTNWNYTSNIFFMNKAYIGNEMGELLSQMKSLNILQNVVPLSAYYHHQLATLFVLPLWPVESHQWQT